MIQVVPCDNWELVNRVEGSFRLFSLPGRIMLRVLCDNTRVSYNGMQMK